MKAATFLSWLAPAIIAVLIGLYPPWIVVTTYPLGFDLPRFAGYQWVFGPPPMERVIRHDPKPFRWLYEVKIDTERLAAEYVVLVVGYLLLLLAVRIARKVFKKGKTGATPT
jgi:hypothetical protein